MGYDSCGFRWLHVFLKKMNEMLGFKLREIIYVEGLAALSWVFKKSSGFKKKNLKKKFSVCCQHKALVAKMCRVKIVVFSTKQFV